MPLPRTWYRQPQHSKIVIYQNFPIKATESKHSSVPTSRKRAPTSAGACSWSYMSRSTMRAPRRRRKRCTCPDPEASSEPSAQRREHRTAKPSQDRQAGQRAPRDHKTGEEARPIDQEVLDVRGDVRPHIPDNRPHLRTLIHPQYHEKVVVCNEGPRVQIHQQDQHQEHPAIPEENPEDYRRGRGRLIYRMQAGRDHSRSRRPCPNGGVHTAE